MIRFISSAIRALTSPATRNQLHNGFSSTKYLLDTNKIQHRYYSAFMANIQNQFNNNSIINNLLTSHAKASNTLLPVAPVNQVPVRTIIKFSYNKGKRYTDHEVPKRFYRLNWGVWIRPKAGRYTKMWLKTMAKRRKRKRHVFTNSTQTWLLDTMTTNYWKRPRYYPEDIYNPYHKREEYFITRRLPLP